MSQQNDTVKLQQDKENKLLIFIIQENLSEKPISEWRLNLPGPVMLLLRMKNCIQMENCYFIM